MGGSERWPVPAKISENAISFLYLPLFSFFSLSLCQLRYRGTLIDPPLLLLTLCSFPVHGDPAHQANRPKNARKGENYMYISRGIIKQYHRERGDTTYQEQELHVGTTSMIQSKLLLSSPSLSPPPLHSIKIPRGEISSTMSWALSSSLRFCANPTPSLPLSPSELLTQACHRTLFLWALSLACNFHPPSCSCLKLTLLRCKWFLSRDVFLGFARESLISTLWDVECRSGRNFSVLLRFRSQIWSCIPWKIAHTD